MEKIHSKEERKQLPRVSVFARDGTPLQPTDQRMARLLVQKKVARWAQQGGAWVLRMRKGNTTNRAVSVPMPAQVSPLPPDDGGDVSCNVI